MEIHFKILHPVTSTVIAPLLVLILLNIKTFKKIPIPRSNSERSCKAARWVATHCHIIRVFTIFLKSDVFISFRRREIAFVKICSLIVIVFIVCNIPRLAVGLFEISRYLHMFISLLTNYNIFQLKNSSDARLFQKRHFLLCTDWAVAGGFRVTLPHYHQLQLQLHHLLRCELKLQEGLVILLGSKQETDQHWIKYYFGTNQNCSSPESISSTCRLGVIKIRWPRVNGSFCGFQYTYKCVLFVISYSSRSSVMWVNRRK